MLFTEIMGEISKKQALSGKKFEKGLAIFEKVSYNTIEQRRSSFLERLSFFPQNIYLLGDEEE